MIIYTAITSAANKMMSEVVFDRFILGIAEIFFLDPRIEGRGGIQTTSPNTQHLSCSYVFLDWSQFETGDHLYKFFAIRFDRRCQLKYLRPNLGFCS